MSQKIRIKLKSYDHALVDKSTDQLVKTVKATGAVVSGPIPLPTDQKIFTVNRSFNPFSFFIYICLLSQFHCTNQAI